MNMSQKNYGQQPRELPAAIEVEQSIIGSLMMNNENFTTISGILEAKHFSEGIHQDIFEAISALIIRGANANPVTVKLQMRNPDIMIGDLSVSKYLAMCMANTVGAYMLVDHSRAVKETYHRRHLISVGSQIVELGYGEGDPIVISEEAGIAQSAISEICADLVGKVTFSGHSLAEEYLAMISKDGRGSSGDGVPIALKEIGTVLSDRKFQAGRLYGLLSSSGEGKTSLTLQIIYRALVDGHPVLFLSYDQSGKECLAQMISQNTGMSFRRQQSGDLTPAEIDRGYERALQIAAMPFEVIDCDSTKDTAARLAGYTRRFVKRNMNGKTPMIVIDHIGTVKPDAGDRTADEGTKAKNIGQQFKSLAKELNAVLLVLQQRSGAGMKRLNPRPIAQDLYGGEAARQPFDAVFYLYRAEVHMQRQLETAQDDKEADKIRARFIQQFRGDVEGMAEIGAIKVRFGNPNERRKVKFEAEFTRYVSDFTYDEQRELI